VDRLAGIAGRVVVVGSGGVVVVALVLAPAVLVTMRPARVVVERRVGVGRVRMAVVVSPATPIVRNDDVGVVGDVVGYVHDGSVVVVGSGRVSGTRRSRGVVVVARWAAMIPRAVEAMRSATQVVWDQRGRRPQFMRRPAGGRGVVRR
jgi:hypothetical protein